MSAADLIDTLNPMIRGWANYHRHAVSKRTFGRVDLAIFSSLRQWARRRHPNKPSRWLKPKYLGRRGNRDWFLFGEICDGEGRINKVWLYYATSTPIKRHVKVKGEANPYDPAHEAYFEDREGAHMLASFGVLELFAISGMNNTDSALCAVPKSLGSLDGAFITASLGLWVARAALRTEFLFIPSATTWFIANIFPYRNRVSPKEAFEVLEPDDGKPSCPVLRGLGGRKVARLLASSRNGVRGDEISPHGGLLARDNFRIRCPFTIHIPHSS